MRRDRESADPLRRLHPKLAALGDLAGNLYWSWDPEGEALFAAADPAAWERWDHNPVRLIRGLTPRRQEHLLADAEFMNLLRRCRSKLRAYLRRETWFQQKFGHTFKGRIAYFSMEYGLCEALPIYAGGLGILAGDHLKSASDLGLPLVGVGIYWKQGYTRQQLDGRGRQVDRFVTLRPEDTPLQQITDRQGRPLRIELPIGPDRAVVRGWRVNVGRVPLVLLDTDLSANRPKVRRLTHRLYIGDRDTRLRQEIVLGIGGWLFLRAMRCPVTVCHLNEGHAAFVALERVAEEVGRERSTFAQARRRVAATSVFTTHTPIPEGNEVFQIGLIEKYMSPYADRMRLADAGLLDLGRVEAGNCEEPFGMTPLACRLCDHRNGVSALHGRVARRMWSGLWPGRTVERVAIGSITNGVHLRTWLHPRMAELLGAYLGNDWIDRQDLQRVWRAVDTIPDEALWRVHQNLKSELIRQVRVKVRQRLRRNQAPAGDLRSAEQLLDPEALTIGFARRFAAYKRAALVFEDPDRFARILNHATRPVQIIFAGKAHPADAGGKALVEKVARTAASPRFRRRVVFLEDYDIRIARWLTAGVDVWLNNPRKPQEASGTSGMKAALHGGLNLSILDGWWPEAFDGKNGWAIGKGRDHDGSRAHDRRDAADLYRVLEHHVVPLYYRQTAGGLPIQWIARMKHALATIPALCNSQRQVKEYATRFYVPAMRSARA